MSFENLILIKPIHAALSNKSYTAPTPIQQQAIAVILVRKDFLDFTQISTGQTATFARPILQIVNGTAVSYSNKLNIEMKSVAVQQELKIKENK